MLDARAASGKAKNDLLVAAGRRGTLGAASRVLQIHCKYVKFDLLILSGAKL